MTKKVWPFLSLIVSVFMMISGCAIQGTAPPPIDAKPVDGGMYQQKVDYLYFILDASSSMTESYGRYVKFDIARSVIQNFNETMPTIDAKVGMRSFGHAKEVSEKSSDLIVPFSAYTRTALPGGLEKVSKAGGISPFSRTLKSAGKDLEAIKAPISMIIVGDGKDMPADTLAAASALKETHGPQLCIYTVQVGNDSGGAKLFSDLANATGCGATVNADTLASGEAMNAFVKETVLTEMADSDGDGIIDSKDKCPDTPGGVKVDPYGCPLDSDGDGVADDKDNCPGTPRGIKVDIYGCPKPMATKRAEVTAAGTWIYKDIQFEVGKSDLKGSSYPTLDEIANALKDQPALNIEIQGHTDSSGQYDYNVNLSQKRAEAVGAYLMSKGIDGSRITSKGFGPDVPIASNKTKDGRAKNRRVEIKPLR